ncbi:class I SAM-dependent RNA methyltransferase [Longispora albida]|uniref:class I SAM-dependent RNA methyltransferase n=1 Tax=Longispora albida TaxID=203523 RepID=UPI0003A51E41|nr:class I SAM-dependent RNA methyltransferase [Longispora albida]
MRYAHAPREVVLDIGPVAHGGHCVARLDELVVFVRHALPGERVRARITEERKGYLRADAIEILQPSPDRVPAPCRYAHPGGCGGCDFQHATPAAQRDLKADVVREQLARLGGLPGVDVTVEELPGGPLGWRTRVQYAVDQHGYPGFHPARSHEVIPIGECLIATPAIRKAPVTGRQWRGVDAVEVVSSSAGELSVLTRLGRGRPRVVSGPARVHESAAGHTWELPAEAFWQVHPESAGTLAAAVLEFLAPQPGERAFDLYGGSGLFSVPLAEAVGITGSVTLVEADPAGTAGAAKLLDGLPQVHVVTGRVERVLEGLGEADIVVLDPPRAGAGAAVIEEIVATGARAVAYVACDPAALARDVRTFRSYRWELAGLRAFDCFPMTHHVECVALFRP